MPVCPVARKVQATPRRRHSASSASVAYILPTEASVPTVKQALAGALFAPEPTA